MGGRVFPMFLPTTPNRDKEPTWEELIEDGMNIQQKMDDSLQKVTDSLCSYISLRKKNKGHGLSTSEVAENLYDEFGREGDELVDSGPVLDKDPDDYQGEEDIAIHTTQSVREISHGACEGLVEDIGVEQVDNKTKYGHLNEGLDHGSSLVATYQLDVLRRQHTGATLVFQNSSLQEYIDKACGTTSSQWYSGELVRYEDEGVDSSRLCLQDQQQVGLSNNRLVSAAVGAGVA